MHHAAAMMLATIVIAAGRKSAIFKTSLEIDDYVCALSSFVSIPLVLHTVPQSAYNFFHIWRKKKREIQVRILRSWS